MAKDVLNELKSLGLIFIDDWKEFQKEKNTLSSKYPAGVVIAGKNPKGKVAYHQVGFGEVNPKQVKEILTVVNQVQVPDYNQAYIDAATGFNEKVAATTQAGPAKVDTQSLEAFLSKKEPKSTLKTGKRLHPYRKHAISAKLFEVVDEDKLIDQVGDLMAPNAAQRRLKKKNTSTAKYAELGRKQLRQAIMEDIREKNPDMSASDVNREMQKIYRGGIKQVSNEALVEQGQLIALNKQTGLEKGRIVSELFGLASQSERIDYVSRHVSGDDLMAMQNQYFSLSDKLSIQDPATMRRAKKAKEFLDSRSPDSGSVQFHPGEAGIQRELRNIKARRATEVSAQVSSNMENVTNVIPALEQEVSQVITKKPIARKTAQRLFQSHSLSAGIAAGGLALVYAANRMRGEQQVGQ